MIDKVIGCMIGYRWTYLDDYEGQNEVFGYILNFFFAPSKIGKW